MKKMKLEKYIEELNQLTIIPLKENIKKLEIEFDDEKTKLIKDLDEKITIQTKLDELLKKFEEMKKNKSRTGT